jgi:hypothetical protein
MWGYDSDSVSTPMTVHLPLNYNAMSSLVVVALTPLPF